MRGIALAIVTLTCVTAYAGRDDCPPRRPDPALLTPDGGKVGAPGIVIASDDQNVPPWKVAGFELTRKQLLPIAPSLFRVVLHPSTGHDGFEIDTVFHGVLHVTVGTTDAPSAPVVENVDDEFDRSSKAAYNRVTVRGAVPRDVVAILIGTIQPSGIVHESWRRPNRIDASTATTTTLRVFERDRCTTPPAGTGETRTGKRVVVQWLDSAGRLSPPSNVVTVVDH